MDFSVFIFSYFGYIANTQYLLFIQNILILKRNFCLIIKAYNYHKDRSLIVRFNNINISPSNSTKKKNSHSKTKNTKLQNSINPSIFF